MGRMRRLHRLVAERPAEGRTRRAGLFAALAVSMVLGVGGGALLTANPHESVVASAATTLRNDLGTLPSMLGAGSTHQEIPLPVQGALDLALMFGLAAVAIAGWRRWMQRQLAPTALALAYVGQPVRVRRQEQPWESASWRAMRWWTADLPCGVGARRRQPR